MNKKIIIGAIAGPVVVWLSAMVIGRMRGDAAGTLLYTHGGFLTPKSVPHGLLLESAAAGALVAYLLTR